MGRAGSTRDFEAPLANLLVGTCELQVYSGHIVYLSVVLDAYSRVILQFIASLENNESVVLNIVVCNEFEHINAMKTDPLAKS